MHNLLLLYALISDCEYLDVALLLDITSGYDTYIKPAALHFLESIRSLIALDRVRIGIVLYGEGLQDIRIFLQPEDFANYDVLVEIIQSVVMERGTTTDLAKALSITKANLFTRNFVQRTHIHDLVSQPHHQSHVVLDIIFCINFDTYSSSSDHYIPW